MGIKMCVPAFLRLTKCGTAILAATMFSGLAMAQKPVKLVNFEYEHVPGEFIVKFANGVTEGSELIALTSVKAKVQRVFGSSGAVLVKLPAATNESATKLAAYNLAQNENIEYIEANTIIHLNNAPDDPDYSKQWGITKIASERAWNNSTGSKDILVAVIDTGVDYNHPDIKDNYWSNPGETGLDAQGKDKSTNQVDDDANGYIDDFRGWDFGNKDNDPLDDHNHGTHCAGVIGAAGNNGVGVVGVNWNVSVVGLKFITASGSGTAADAIAAIEYATKIGANVTSNSWGGGPSSDTMKAAIASARDAGVIFVAAAGNSTNNNDSSPTYPASYGLDNIVAVAATDNADKLATFSNYGVKSVHLAAPGVNVYSTVRNNQFQNMSGTSMAAPHVAGAVALIMGAQPNSTWREVRAKLLASVDKVPGLATKVVSGGRLNVGKAVEE